MPRIQNKRGLFANLPSSSLLSGELFITTDRNTVHYADDATTMKALVPAIDALGTMPVIQGAADFLIMHDATATGVKEKKITFDALKTALNIPSGSTDELVAVISGGQSGYLWGTDGTDGVLRMNTSMVMTKDAGNAFITLAVGDVDCGTF